MTEEERDFRVRAAKRVIANAGVLLQAPTHYDVKKMKELYGVRPLAKLLDISPSMLTRAAAGERQMSPHLWTVILLLLDEHPTHRIFQRKTPAAVKLIELNGGQVLDREDEM